MERKVVSTNPVVVEYHLSKHGSSIKDLIRRVIGWDLKHREGVLGKGKNGD